MAERMRDGLKQIENELIKSATPIYLLLTDSHVSFEDTSTIDRVVAAEVLNGCMKNERFRGEMISIDHHLALLTQHETAKWGASGEIERQGAHSLLRLYKISVGEELSPDDVDEPYLDAIKEYGRRGMFTELGPAKR